ncbi:hypothetical protein CsatB_017988 [Cannabis sativa]
MAASTSQIVRLNPLRNASLSLSSKLPLSSAFSVSLNSRWRQQPHRLVLIVSAGLDAKPMILVAEKLGAAGLDLLKDFANVDCSYNLTPEEIGVGCAWRWEWGVESARVSPITNLLPLCTATIDRGNAGCS